MLFKKDNPTITVTEVMLKKKYSFMYENFVVSSQQKLLLLLERTDKSIDALQFDFLIYKYGYPNDEVSHPLSKYGLGFYGLYKVNNSPWLTELLENNRQHQRHIEGSFDNYKHYIAKLKDVTVEVICSRMEEKQLTQTELLTFIQNEINSLVP